MSIICLTNPVLINAQNKSNPIITISVIGIDSLPIKNVTINCRSGKFIDYEETTSYGRYSTAGHANSKYLKIGNRFSFFCSKKGYRTASDEFTIGSNGNDNDKTIILQETSIEMVYLSGTIVDGQSGEVIEDAQVQIINNKGRTERKKTSNPFGLYRIEIEKDSLTSSGKLKIAISHKDYEPEIKILDLPLSGGELESQEIKLKKRKTPFEEIDKSTTLGYLPYVGHFSRNEKWRGITYSSIGVSSIALFICSGIRKSNLKDEALNTINQTSRNQILERADNCGDLMIYSSVSFGLSTILSFATNWIEEDRIKKSFTINSGTLEIPIGVSLTYNF